MPEPMTRDEWDDDQTDRRRKVRLEEAQLERDLPATPPGVTVCELDPWGKQCGQVAVGLIRDNDHQAHPACRFHLWAAEEFDWQPVPLSEVIRGAIDTHAAATFTALHRTQATHGLTCSTCDGGGCPDCTDPAH